MSKIYVGIDHSLSGTGIAILGEDGSLKHLATCKSEPDGTSVRQRVWRFRGLAGNVQAEIIHFLSGGTMIGVCCFEGYSFGSNKSHHSAIIESGYEVRSHMVATVGGAIYEVPPTTVKKFACGKGNADKSAVVSSLTKKHGVEFGNDNEADAYALARMAYHIGSGADPGNQAAREAVATVTAEKVKKSRKKAG